MPMTGRGESAGEAIERDPASAPGGGEDGEGEGLRRVFRASGAGDHCSRRIKPSWQCRGNGLEYS